MAGIWKKDVVNRCLEFAVWGVTGCSVSVMQTGPPLQRCGVAGLRNKTYSPAPLTRSLRVYCSGHDYGLCTQAAALKTACIGLQKNYYASALVVAIARLVGTHFGAILMYVCKYSLRPTMSLSHSDPDVISHIASEPTKFHICYTPFKGSK